MAFGLYRTVRAKNPPDTWVARAFFLNLWISVGSLYFHATLTRFSQAMARCHAAIFSRAACVTAGGEWGASTFLTR